MEKFYVTNNVFLKITEKIEGNKKGYFELKDDKNMDLNFLGKDILNRLFKIDYSLNKILKNQFNIIEDKKDSYKKVYEGSKMHFHKNFKCEFLSKNFLSMRIPEKIRKKFGELNIENIIKYRHWFNETFDKEEFYLKNGPFSENQKIIKIILEKTNFLEKLNEFAINELGISEFTYGEIEKDLFDTRYIQNSGIQNFSKFLEEKGLNIDDKNLEGKIKDKLYIVLYKREDFIKNLDTFEKYIIELFGIKSMLYLKNYEKSKDHFINILNYYWIDFGEFNSKKLKEYGFDKVYYLLKEYNENYLSETYKILFYYINAKNGNLNNFFERKILEKLNLIPCSYCFRKEEEFKNFLN